MKYTKNVEGYYTAYDEKSEAYLALKALPDNRRPEFLSATDAGVVAYLAAQAKAVKQAKAKQANKASTLAKLAKVADKAGFPLTDEELAALQ